MNDKQVSEARAMKIAFYATMKPPDDPVPSGDRTMARQLFKALELGGHHVELLSRMKCRVRAPGHLDEVREDACCEVKRIAAAWRAGAVPDVVISYHVYYKSPDLIGAVLAQEFSLPYVTVEASHAGKRSTGEWAPVQALSDAAIAQAALNICFTGRDREGVAKVARPGALAMLAPFIDLDGFGSVPSRQRDNVPVELISVAMMLKGTKMESWRALASAIGQLEPGGWRLTLVGDGPMRGEVERLFDGLEGVRFAGQVDRRGVAGFLARSDVFVWPGIGEAFGLAYLEAQAMGLPVVAMRSGGIEAVVRDGQSGVLIDEGDVTGLAASLGRLIGDVDVRHDMGARSAAFVRGERSLESASVMLDGCLRQVMK